MTSDIRARRKPADWLRERQIIHGGMVVLPRGERGRATDRRLCRRVVESGDLYLTDVNWPM